MPTVKREAGLRMVEAHGLPVRRIVAALAAEAVGPPVRIDLGVTADAGDLRVLEFRTGMAVRALHRRVLAQQREGRLVMVEADRLPPDRGVVAGAAGRAQLARMPVVPGVATAAADVELDLVRRLHMAGLAFDLAVGPGEREAGLAVVEGGVLPARGGMAALALGTVQALVLVVLGVTGQALRPRRLDPGGGRRRGMAGIAGQPGMATGQCPARAAVVELRDLPVPGIVALGAVGPVLAVVDVVLGVAAAAAGLGIVIAAIGVAVAAIGPGMGPHQGKAGPAVIKVGRLPGDGGMAGAALGAEPALVCVVLGVTGDAGRRRGLEILGLVAALAGGLCVGPQQREGGLAVVEAGLLPARLGVAVGAFGSQRALVHVILRVAADAGHRGRAEPGARGVAGGAGDLQMRAAQGIFGLVVVEALRVEDHELGAPSLVLRVAGAALHPRHLRVLSVEAPVLGHVGGDRLVAVIAHPVLRGLVEGRVAGLAVALELGMRGGQRAGGDQLLDHCLGAGRRRGDQDGRQQCQQLQGPGQTAHRPVSTDAPRPRE